MTPCIAITGQAYPSQGVASGGKTQETNNRAQDLTRCDPGTARQRRRKGKQASLAGHLSQRLGGKSARPIPVVQSSCAGIDRVDRMESRLDGMQQAYAKAAVG